MVEFLLFFMNKEVEFMASFETYQIGKSIKFARSYNHLRIIVSNDTTNFKYIYIYIYISDDYL